MSFEKENSDVECAAPAYHKQEIVAVLTAFYHFLSTLPYIESSVVSTPPSSGWPNVTPENFSQLGKNDEVIDLLKHLPYIDLTGHQYAIAPDTYPTDYRGEAFQRDVTEETIGRCTPLGDVKFPEWVINLTHGSRDGTYVMLDTTDGTVTEYNIQDDEEHRYKEDDPRCWRNHCGREARPLMDLLDEWKNKYYTLYWMGHAMNGWPIIMWADRGDENYEEVKIMKKYGWPYSFDREACKQALMSMDRARMD